MSAGSIATDIFGSPVQRFREAKKQREKEREKEREKRKNNGNGTPGSKKHVTGPSPGPFLAGKGTPILGLFEKTNKITLTNIEGLMVIWDLGKPSGSQPLRLHMRCACLEASRTLSPASGPPRHGGSPSGHRFKRLPF